MKSFFNPENFLWQWFAHLADYFILSCLWALCSAPVVTVGAASIALYDTVAHCVRNREEGMFRRFFRTFKNELGRGIALTLLWTAAGLILNFGYQILVQISGESHVMNAVRIAYFITLVIPVGLGCWAIAIESRFTHTLVSLHRTALSFTFLHIPHTLAIVVLFIVGLNLVMNIPFLVMFLPGMVVAFQSLFIEKVFKKYLPGESEEETP